MISRSLERFDRWSTPHVMLWTGREHEDDLDLILQAPDGFFGFYLQTGYVVAWPDPLYHWSAMWARGDRCHRCSLGEYRQLHEVTAFHDLVSAQGWSLVTAEPREFVRDFARADLFIPAALLP